MHISRDSTPIEAREKAKASSEQDMPPSNPKKGGKRKKKGSPEKDEPLSVPEETRIERQDTMTLEEMLKDLPR